MPKKQSDIVVITKTKDLANYVFTVTQKSPKAYRFTFVGRMQNYVLDAVENLHRANAVQLTPDTVERREGYQCEAMTALRLLSTVAQMGCEHKAITEKQLEQIGMQVITAKLRDAVPVCFIENGREIKRYRNIEIPDEIKKLPFAAFEFSVPETGAITFKITFEPGILPATWPESRQRKARRQATAEAPDPVPAERITEAPAEEPTPAPAPDAEPAEEAMPADIDAHFNVTGERRKALVEGVAGAIGERAIYQNAPSFAYVIGAYTVDKTGRLTGPANERLMSALQMKGFIAE